jgi:hypothetical protein
MKSRQAPAHGTKEPFLSVFIVTVKYSGQPVQDAATCKTRESAAHAAAQFLASSKRPDGELPVAVGIVVEPEKQAAGATA